MKTQSKKFKNLILQRAIIGFVLAMCIGTAIIIVVPGVYYEIMQVEEGDPIIGSPGVSFTQNPATAALEIDLLRTSDFTLESGWRYDDYSLSPDSTLSYENNTDGVQVTGTRSDFRMYRCQNVLVDNFEYLFFSFYIEPIAGPLSCGIRAICEEGWQKIAELEEVIEWNENEPDVFNYTAPMNLLRAGTMHWSLNIRFEIRLEFPESGTARISDARIQAVADTPVVPTTFDFQSMDGASLFGRPEGWSIFYPFIKATSNSTGDLTYLMMYNRNETVFLPVDNYTMEYSWFLPLDIRVLKPFNLNITPGTSQFIAIRMNVTRVCIESNLQIPLWIELYSCYDSDLSGPELLSMYEFFPSHSSFVYLPGGLGSIRVKIGLYHPTLQTRTSFEGLVTIGSKNHVHVLMHFPIFNFGGYGLDTIQTLVVLITLGLLGAIFVSLTHAATPLPFSKIFTKERVPSFILLLVSYLLPWEVWSDNQFTYIGPILTSRAFSHAIGLESFSSNPGLTLLHFEITGYELFWMMLIFWLPLLFMLKQIIVGAPLSKTPSTLIPHAVPGVLSLLIVSIPVTTAPGIGAFLAAISFIVLILQVIHKSRYCVE